MINCLRGSVTVRVESAYPERVVNLCAAHAIPFWDLRWIDGATFTVRTSFGALPRLQAVTQQVDCSVTVVRRTGLPVLLLSLRRRYVLLAGAALLLPPEFLSRPQPCKFLQISPSISPEPMV